MLGEAFSESLTPSKLRTYIADLADLSREQLAVAFRRARRELQGYFPRIATLRVLAGAVPHDQANKVEAESAWTWAQDYLRQWGADRLPIRRRGAWIEAPPIPPRIDYALRRIGGLRGLNQLTEQSRPFMFRDFCEAYSLAPIAATVGPYLFGALEGTVKQLPPAPAAEPNRDVQEEQAKAAEPKAGPLSPEQVRERRAMLARQAEMLAQRYGRSSAVTDGHHAARAEENCGAAAQ